MSSDITILEIDGPNRFELSVEVKARSVGVSIWDEDDYKVVWFDMTSPEHRTALRGMIEVLQHELSVCEEDGQ
jgi:hypothetical protein